MPKKSRTPPPPRRVQAPRARTGDRDGERGRRSLYVLVGVALAVLAAAAVGVALLAFGGSGGTTQLLEDAGCTLERMPVEYARVQGQETRHVGDQLPDGYEYPSFPGVAGTHFAQQSPLGVYDEPIEQGHLVHNTEHGAVLVQYGRDVPQAEVDAILEWYREDPTALLVAPLPALGDRISLGAWTAEFDQTGTRVTTEQGVVAKCPRFDEDAFEAFVDEFSQRGPERATPEQLQPGGG